jgi:hypothetical protein
MALKRCPGLQNRLRGFAFIFSTLFYRVNQSVHSADDASMVPVQGEFMNINAIAAGKSGMMAAQASLANHAEAVAKFGQTEDDIVTPVVGMMQDSVQFNAAATVVREADEMQKSTLDMLA